MAKSLLTRSKTEGEIGRDWTQGSITKNLLSLSWPMLISYTIQMIGPTIDMVWIGKLGSNSIAGVGVSVMTVQFANSLIWGLFVGTTAMIARFIGAKDAQTANRVAQQSFVIGVSFSIAMVIIGLFMSDAILALFGVEPGVAAEGAAYLRIQFVGMATMSTISLSQSIMQASGDAFTPMKINIGYRLFQVVLCPALIFGWWIFPELGVRGAALSNVITQGIGGAIALRILFTGRTRTQVQINLW